MLELDHIVIGASDLDSAIAHFQERYGLDASRGGVHPDYGTHNALIGAGSCYIELLAPMPGAKCTIPDLRKLSEPTLFHYALRSSDLNHIEQHAMRLGFESAGVQEGRRKTGDGALLSWRILFLRGHAHGATVPFFIDWQNTPRPSETLPAQVSDVSMTVQGSLIVAELIGSKGTAISLKGGAPSLAVACRAKNQSITFKSQSPFPSGL